MENGKHTLFCLDVLVGGVSFKDRFSRLFDMSLFKGVSVFDMCQLGWGGGWRGVEVVAKVVHVGRGAGGGT